MLNARPFRGPVRIGIPQEYGYSVLTRALGAFAKRHPKVDVTVSHRQNRLKRSMQANSTWRWYCNGDVFPIAIYEDSAWCREFAIRSNEKRGLDFRVASTSRQTVVELGHGRALAKLGF
ncbi:substrate-binding domain-containing protein [Mesorhizobium sp. 131-2-1]|uniref:substrate-binding domain-containing protein n=1 Tax=Mesorhizobium sp. 131-2-1 TaxID=2744518 RepID=UPI001FD3B0C9|nr:substrate-binding domain-containing protein [Mesorhizobium sp. 131-2-1]